MYDETLIPGEVEVKTSRNASFRKTVIGVAVLGLAVGGLAGYAGPTVFRHIQGTVRTGKAPPYMVRIIDTATDEVCGGSIVSLTQDYAWVLTADHCTTKSPISKIGVIFTGGITSLTSENLNAVEVIKRPPKSAAVPIYKTRLTQMQDIALLKVKITQSNGGARAINYARVRPAVGKSAEIMGYEGGPTFFQATVRVVKCSIDTVYRAGVSLNSKSVYEGLLQSQSFKDGEYANLCVAGNAIPCAGDSGGPAVVDNTVVGTVAWGSQPCGGDYNTASIGMSEQYTDVAKYAGWISSTIAKG